MLNKELIKKMKFTGEMEIKNENKRRNVS